MKERYKTPSAVFAIFIKENQVLLQKRQNTGYMDGYYDFAASGHVEQNESMTDALIREVREELAVDISRDVIEFGTLMHKHEENIVYYNGFFIIWNSSYDFKINEPEKCSELKWADMNHLPEKLIFDRRLALQNIFKKIPYSEIGWNDVRKSID